MNRQAAVGGDGVPAGPPRQRAHEVRVGDGPRVGYREVQPGGISEGFLKLSRDEFERTALEHLDTLYAFRALFEPAGITRPEQVTWAPDSVDS